MAKMKKNLNEAKEALDELLFASRDFTDEANKAAKAVFGIGTQARETTKSFRDISSSVREIDNLLDDVLDGTKTINDLNKEAQKFDERRKKNLTEYGLSLSKVGITTEDINKIKKGTLNVEDALKAAGVERGSVEYNMIDIFDKQREVMEETQKEMDDMVTHSQDIEKNMGLMGTSLSSVEGVMKKLGMGGLADRLGFDDAIKAGRKMSANMIKTGEGAGGIGNKLKVAGKMAGMMGKSLMASLGPVALIASAIKFIVDSFTKLDKMSGEVADNFGVSYKEGKNLAMEMNDIATSTQDLDATTKNLVKSQMDMNKTLGTSVQFSDQQVQDYNKIAQRLKLSGEAQAFFFKQGMKSGKGIKESLRDVTSTTTDLKARTGIMLNQKDIEEEVAKVSANQLLTNKGNLKSITEMVFKAKQYGFTMDGLENSASSLLDFESSIANELKAELLTGKDLNLEKARQMALDDNMAGLAEELSKNGASAAEWAKMNRIEKEAMAAALGMGVDQMAETINKEATLQKLKEQGANDISKGQEYYNMLIEQGMTKEQAQAEMKKNGMQDALDAQIENETKADKMASFMEKISDLGMMLADLFMPLVDALMQILPPILKILQPIFKIIGLIVNVVVTILQPIFTALGTVFEFIGHHLDNIMSVFDGIGKVVMGIFSGDGGMIMEGLEMIGSSIARILLSPFQLIVDLFVGIVNYIIDGINWVLESVGASPFENWESPSLAGMVGLAEGGIVMGPTNALIGEGGEPEAVVPLSKAEDMGFGGGDMEETNRLLKKLISAVEKGGDIEINGQKVGEALTKYNYSY
jgi:hypothetical protein